MMRETLETIRERSLREAGISEPEFERLAAELGSPADLKRLSRWIKRRSLGEPIEYIIGAQQFRGRRFAVDKRVYITDSELTHLVDAVIEAGKRFIDEKERPPVIVEFGVGCGSLAISVKKELPIARVIGLDIDSDSIAVAFENARQHQVDLELYESDLFSDLPGDLVPDILFGDPPWGDDHSLYEDDRDAAHYQAMPILSAFPSGGITAVHEAILKEVEFKGWPSSVFLNLGVLQDAQVEPLGKKARTRLIFKFEKARIMHCNY